MSCIQLRDAPRGTCGPSNRLRITQVHSNSFFICGHSLQDWLQGSQQLHTGTGSNSSEYSVGWGEQHIFILLSEVGNNTAIHNKYDYRPCGCVLFHVSFRFCSSQRSCLYSTLHLSENRINQPVCVFTVCRGSVLKVKNRNTHHHYKNHVSLNITCQETGHFTCHEKGFCVFLNVSVFWTSGSLHFFFFRFSCKTPTSDAVIQTVKYVTWWYQYDLKFGWLHLYFSKLDHNNQWEKRPGAADSASKRQ